jgi:hypothetical protein
MEEETTKANKKRKKCMSSESDSTGGHEGPPSPLCIELRRKDEEDDEDSHHHHHPWRAWVFDAERLTRSSAYFAAMLTSGFAESGRSTVTVGIPCAEALQRESDWQRFISMLCADGDEAGRATIHPLAEAMDAAMFWPLLVFVGADISILRRAAESMRMCVVPCDRTRLAVTADPWLVLGMYALALKTLRGSDPLNELLPNATDIFAASWRGWRAGKAIATEETTAGALSAYLGFGVRTVRAGMRTTSEGGDPLAFLAAMCDWASPLSRLDRARGGHSTFVDPFALPFRVPAWDRGAGESTPPVLVAGVDAFAERMAALHPTFGATALELASEEGAQVFIAGGSVAASMQVPPLGCILEGSDVDVWICGADEFDRRRAFARVVATIFARHPRCVAAGVVTFFPPPPPPATQAAWRIDRQESLQIVYTDGLSPAHVVLGFDMTHLQAFYCRRKLMCSWESLWCMACRATRVRDGGPISTDRLERVQRKGFAIASDANGAIDMLRVPPPPPSPPPPLLPIDPLPEAEALPSVSSSPPPAPPAWVLSSVDPEEWAGVAERENARHMRNLAWSAYRIALPAAGEPCFSAEEVLDAFAFAPSREKYRAPPSDTSAVSKEDRIRTKLWRLSAPLDWLYEQGDPRKQGNPWSNFRWVVRSCERSEIALSRAPTVRISPSPHSPLLRKGGPLPEDGSLIHLQKDSKQAKLFQKALKGAAHRACSEIDDLSDFGARWPRLVLGCCRTGHGGCLDMQLRHSSSSSSSSSSSIVHDGLTGERVAVKSIPNESLLAASVVCETVIIKRSSITPIATVRDKVVYPPYLDELLRLAAERSREVSSLLAMDGEYLLDHMQAT